MQGMHGSEGLDGLWMSISELATLKGLSRQSMHERVSRLQQLGTVEVRAGAGRTRLVNVAQFDRAVGETVDAVRMLNGRGRPAEVAPIPGDPVLAREQARKVAYEADMRKLDLDERLARLVPRDGVEAAQDKAAAVIIGVLDTLPDYAEELAAATASGGTAGSRAKLKEIAREVRMRLAAAMREMADEAKAETTGTSAPEDRGQAPI